MSLGNFKRVGKITIASMALLLAHSSAFAKKTNQAVYEEPFDIASGGASLTRASRDAVMFANPAQMPYGAKFHRWIGMQMTSISSPDSASFAQGLANGAAANSSELVDTAFKTPIHFGFINTISYITNNFALGTLARFEPDIRAKERGETGVPEVRFRAEAYGGGVFSYAFRTTPWFSLGVTAKYLYVSEPDLRIDLADQSSLETLSDPAKLSDEVGYGRGIGYDLGSLLFLQGHWIDYRLALKVDDLGGTEFSGGAQEPFQQTMSAGMGLTFHNAVDAIHLAVDYRDIQNAYEEHWFKKTYAGMKIVLREYIGFGVGVYNGFISYGMRADLFIMKVGLTSYTRELGDYPGEDSRKIYQLYFSTGF